MPLHVISQHTKEDMRTDAIGQVMIDGPDFQIDALVASKGPLNMSKVFISTYGLLGFK